VYGANPLRGLPKPQQRRIHRAVILVATAFAPHAIWSMWATPATFVVAGAIILFFGFTRGVPREQTTIHAAEESHEPVW
jgi:DMSO/TMAO reductase YedYZ heme-binding membrane subunit